MTHAHPLPKVDASVSTRLRQLLARLAGRISRRDGPAGSDLSRMSVRELGKRYDRLQTAYRQEADMQAKDRISQQQIILTTELRRRRMLAGDT